MAATASGRQTRADIGVAEMLHHIRASARAIRSEALQHRGADGAAVAHLLGRRLASAILHESPFDIAVILGSGAELSCVPDDRALAHCIRLVQAHGSQTTRAVVWAVRHRCVRTGADYQRFEVDGC